MDDSDVRKTLGVDGGGRRWGRWAAVAVGLVLIALFAASRLAPTGSGRYTYETLPVTRGTLLIKVTAVGSIEPSNAVAVSSELSGIVAKVHVSENDEVEAGQVLAELDTDLLEAQARQSQASVHASEATVAQSRATMEGASVDLSRAEQLHDKGAISAAEFDRARTAHRQAVAGFALAEAQLEQARASALAAKANLSKTRIVSPIAGVVLERSVEEGQAVVSSLQAATLFRVAEDLRKMTLDVEVDEADIGRIKAGQQADFTVSAYPERVFDAEVTKVHLAPVDSSDVVTYLATLSVDNPGLELLPGMTATASITAERLEDALLVPNQALRFEPPEGSEPQPEPVDGRRRARVYALDGDAVPILVFPGASDGRHTVVEGQVYEGQELVIAAERTRRGSKAQ